ncbi:hypothetical protein [Enterobacter quasiroggenkampii]|uniref:hypothetical protein n=1 Tax=Enterobacter quasiroggenkampii TaxID=2497436 RepID=UPI0021D175B8|nr:hypothetical protein [Enterobacter quasiroggenkampii]MCU6407865.1 hypothetical protein [Enterobacter quasiroggenkampii]
MKQKFIEWFTRNNNGCSPAMEGERSFVHEKTQHMFDAYQAGVAEGEARCAALAAENAGLKAGLKYFSYSEIAGFEEHGTAELAMKSADADLAGERDEASSEGWSEETDTICWGIIVQKAVENKFEKPSEENGWIGWSDYALLPSIETPATDAFLAEVRAQGVDAAIEELNQLAERSEKEAPIAAENHRSAALYLQLLSTQIRKGVQS